MLPDWISKVFFTNLSFFTDGSIKVFKVNHLDKKMFCFEITMRYKTHTTRL